MQFPVLVPGYSFQELYNHDFHDALNGTANKSLRDNYYNINPHISEKVHLLLLYYHTTDLHSFIKRKK